MIYMRAFLLVSLFCIQVQAVTPDSERVTSPYVAIPAQFGSGMLKGSFAPFYDIVSMGGENTKELQKLLKGILISPFIKNILAPELLNPQVFEAGNHIGYFFILYLLLRTTLTSSTNNAIQGSLLLGLGIKGLLWAVANKELLMQQLENARTTKS